MCQLKFTALIFLGLVCFQVGVLSQHITQTIRGSIVDMETKTPLLAATIAIYHESELVEATISDQDGLFRLENVPVGRYTLICSYMGYREHELSDVVVSAGKEVILPIEMEESPVEIEEISILAGGRKGETLNKMAFVSGRNFSVEESNRYAGSRGDVARMASNYAGVQGNDDSNNDLVIWGNSPLGVL